MTDQSRDSIVVLTRDSPESVIAANGSGSWRINVEKWDGAVDWLILTNRVGDKRRITLVGRVSGFEPDTGGQNPGRYAVKIDGYALTDNPSLTFESESTNPVQFRNGAEVLRFDPRELDLTPVPKQTLRQSYERPGAEPKQPLAKPLSIAEAKAGLAIFFGVSPDQVEITIRA